MRRPRDRRRSGRRRGGAAARLLGPLGHPRPSGRRRTPFARRIAASRARGNCCACSASWIGSTRRICIQTTAMSPIGPVRRVRRPAPSRASMYPAPFSTRSCVTPRAPPAHAPSTPSSSTSTRAILQASPASHRQARTNGQPITRATFSTARDGRASWHGAGSAGTVLLSGLWPSSRNGNATNAPSTNARALPSKAIATAGPGRYRSPRRDGNAP